MKAVRLRKLLCNNCWLENLTRKIRTIKAFNKYMKICNCIKKSKGIFIICHNIYNFTLAYKKFIIISYQRVNKKNKISGRLCKNKI